MPKPPFEAAGGVLVAVVSLATLPGCSIKKMAINSLGNALAEAGDSYSSDEDPELVEGAIPFGLKTIEALLAESPRHEGLLYAAVSGFTQYAYGFVQQNADFVEDEDYSRAEHQRDRAKRLYLRALGYGMRALEEEFDDFETRLRRNPDEVLGRARREHVRLLYWTAASWGAAISIAIEDSELTADQDLMAAMMRRGLALDEGFEYGAIHEFFISFEGGRPASAGASVEQARYHLKRAMELSGGNRAFPLVSFAEAVSVAEQNREEFDSLMHQALAVDIDALPAARLSNVIAQRRARWLLGRTDELFIE